MYVVPNNLLNQFTNEFRSLYPAAKLLVVTNEDLPPVSAPVRKDQSEARREEIQNDYRIRRQTALNKIALNDWDGVIMTYTVFNKMPVSGAAYNGIFNEWLNEAREIILALKNDSAKQSKLTVKQLENFIKNM
jgi:N12 class adenine-specific DNA methylase